MDHDKAVINAFEYQFLNRLLRRIEDDLERDKDHPVLRLFLGTTCYGDFAASAVFELGVLGSDDDAPSHFDWLYLLNPWTGGVMVADPRPLKHGLPVRIAVRLSGQKTWAAWVMSRDSAPDELPGSYDSDLFFALVVGHPHPAFDAVGAMLAAAEPEGSSHVPEAAHEEVTA